MNNMNANGTGSFAGTGIKFPKMLDNKRNGKVIDKLKNDLVKVPRLSVISAYFTI